MAPSGDMFISSYNNNNNNKPPILRKEGLQRAASDLSFELSREVAAATAKLLTPISEVEDAKCECCGMSEEFTPEYISRVKAKFFGKWICGLCSEAVKEEVEKKGVRMEEALNAHMSVCVRFNRVGRTQPVLGQAAAMREILKKCSTSLDLRKSKKGGGIMRTSSCIPAITKEMNGRRHA